MRICEIRGLESIARVSIWPSAFVMPFSTAVAISPMNTNGASAFRASPSDFFICSKLPNSKHANVFQILDHAHAVFGSVPFIQMFQTSTREPLTLKAKSRFGTLQAFTIFDFAVDAGGGFTSVTPAAARTFIFISQICHADGTVHSAGGNQ